MGLGTKGPAGKSVGIGALGHETDQDLLGLLQIRDHHPFKLATSLGILGQLLELLERQGQMPPADLLPQ